MPKAKNNLTIIGLVCVIIVFAYIGFWYSKNFPRKSDLAESTSPPEPFMECGYADDLRRVIEYAPGTLAKTWLTVPNPKLLWKLSPDTPFVGLTADVNYSFQVYTPNKKPEELLAEFEQKLSSKGFLVNKANSYDITIDVIENGRSIQLAFERGGNIYLLRYGESFQYPEDPQSYLINFYCGKRDQDYANVYKQLLPFAAQEQWDEKSILQIWYNQSSVVVLDISGIQMIGGTGSIWTNQNNKWEKIYEGQSDPLCPIYEERNIGKGLSCVDEQTGVSRTAN